MIGFNRLSIQSKMILLFLVVSLLSISVMAWIGFSSAKAALTRSIEQQLQGVRVTKTTTIEAMLKSLQDQVVALSDGQIVLDGMRSFRDGFRALEYKTLIPTEEEGLKNFYANDFLPALSKNIEGEPVLEQYIPAGSAARYLQYHYIVENTHPYLKKEALEESPTDRSMYGAAHTRLHKQFLRAARIFGFEDVMLVDIDTLDIVYSLQKTTEFGTNLLSGPYATSHLADKVRELRLSRDRDDLKIADFEPYRPSLGLPMGFVLSPIFDGPKMIGALVIQFPIDIFNKVLTGDYNWAGEGLGETGEVYMVGPDDLMRTRSRFMHTDPAGFAARLRGAGVSSEIVEQVEKRGEVMNILPVHNESIEEALKGHSGIGIVEDYRGESVLSAYGSVELDGFRWAVVAAIDEAEAFKPVREFGWKVVVVGSGVALLVSLLAIVCAQLITRPLRLLTAGARRLGAGQTDVQVEVTSRDEFGELSRVFNEMAHSVKTQTDKLEAQVRENHELLLNILPASAVAQRREGDERANREFADVTVLFAEICGMEEFGERDGEGQALAALGDLIGAFDEAAEKFGIEKVKTIGASYLAACGLSVTRPDHARRTILFADQMRQVVEAFNREHRAELRLAIGINSGPVVGGVVGKRKFLYDLWGDTVTIAKRLAASEGAVIRVTTPVRDRMGEQFQFSGPVRVDSGSVAPLEAWHVVS